MHYGQDWNGMILHLYRQIDCSMFSANALRAAQSSPNKTYTTFGNFDRLCFTPVKSFVDYLKRSGSAYQWIGGRKDIMLYPIRKSDNSDRHFIFVSTQNDGSPELRFSANRERRFLILSMLYISDKVKSKLRSYETILTKCKHQVQRIVAKYNELVCNNDEQEIFFEMFGTFNSAEIGILWGADQFTDVQYLVDQIRFLSLGLGDDVEQLFTASYSIVSCYNRSAVTTSVCDLKGTAYIQLATSTSRNPIDVPSKTPISKYLKQLQKTVKEDSSKACFVINSCAGEYDYIIQTQPPQLGLLSKLPDGRYGPLHGKNSNFTKYFANSTTRLAYSEKDICSAVLKFPWGPLLRIQIPDDGIEMQRSPYWDEVRHLCAGKSAYENYNKLLQNSISNVSSLATNVELLYGDFIRAANATPDRQWAYDLEMQIDTAFDVLSQFRDADDNEKLRVNREYIEKSEIILQRLRQQIQHVTEAGKLSFDEPSLHVASTVEYDLLFHMYYGAVKDILDCIYDRPHGPTQASQSTLIPIIQFELTPIVNSVLYYDIPEIHNRIVDISIPYDAWGEPNVYIAYLVHEICHYLAPYNRDVRNDIFAKFIITEIVVNAFQHMVLEMIEAYRASKDLEDQNTRNDSQNAPKASNEDDGVNQKTLLLSNIENALIAVASELRAQIFTFIENEDISSLMTEDALRSGEEDAEHLERIKKIGAGDTAWNVFREALLSWCSGETGYDSRGSLARLIVKALNKARENMDLCFSLLEHDLVQQGFDACTNTFDGCKDFIYSILIYDCLGSDAIEPTLDFFGYVQSDTDTWAPKVNSQLRELLPDQAMVELTGLNIAEYLFTFSLSQEKLFNTPFKLLEDNGLPIRVGYIVDHLLNKKDQPYQRRMEAFLDCRSDFLKLYTSYMCLCNWSDTDKKFDVASIELKANQWFDFFLSMLSNYYSQYGCYQEAFDFLSKELYMPLVKSTKKARLRDSTKSFYSALRNEDVDELFGSNLKAIWSFQHQKFLRELSLNEMPILSKKAHFSPSTSPLDSRCVLNGYHSIYRPILKTDELYGTFDSILRDLSDSHMKVFGTKIQRNGLWYRGSQNASHGVLPSAMVHFLDSKLLKTSLNDKGKNARGPLWSYQKDLLERFKYQADGASEFINSASFTMPDYIALMQHYQQHTCYLDWSEDAFSSLFFALEKYIMEETIEYPFANASLYVLDPMLYNRARKMLVRKYLDKVDKKAFNKSTKWLLKQNHALLSEVDGYIPNLSTRENLSRLPMFTLDLPSNFTYTAHKKKSHHEITKPPADITLDDVAEEILNLPLAVHTSRLNPRIRTQSGQFMAFSPFSLPAYGPDSNDIDDPKKEGAIRSYRFTYISLLRIQDFFLRSFPDQDPFLYELRIHAGSKADIANYLRSTGINRYRIYPELTHLKL